MDNLCVRANDNRKYAHISFFYLTRDKIDKPTIVSVDKPDVDDPICVNLTDKNLVYVGKFRFYGDFVDEAIHNAMQGYQQLRGIMDAVAIINKERSLKIPQYVFPEFAEIVKARRKNLYDDLILEYSQGKITSEDIFRYCDSIQLANEILDETAKLLGIQRLRKKVYCQDIMLDIAIGIETGAEWAEKMVDDHLFYYNELCKVFPKYVEFSDKMKGGNND